MPCRIRVRVASVRSVRDPEGREGVAVEFVEVRERPPAAVFMSPRVFRGRLGRLCLR